MKMRIQGFTWTLNLLLQPFAKLVSFCNLSSDVSDVGASLQNRCKTRAKLVSGFTLIELLVVIAIIGLLSSIVMVSLSSVRVKARDAKRVSDIRSLQLALEMYYDTNRAYLSGTGNAGTALASLASLAPAYIQSIPKDPLGSDYAYVGCTTGGAGSVIGYHLGASLEDVGNIALGGDSDIDKDSVNCSGDFRGLNTDAPSSTAGSGTWACGAGSSAAAGTVGPNGTEKCYDIKR